MEWVNSDINGAKYSSTSMRNRGFPTTPPVPSCFQARTSNTSSKAADCRLGEQRRRKPWRPWSAYAHINETSRPCGPGQRDAPLARRDIPERRMSRTRRDRAPRLPLAARPLANGRAARDDVKFARGKTDSKRASLRADIGGSRRGGTHKRRRLQASSPKRFSLYDAVRLNASKTVCYMLTATSGT